MTPLVRRYVKTSFVFRLAIAAGGLGQMVGTLLLVDNMWRRVRMLPAAALH